MMNELVSVIEFNNSIPYFTINSNEKKIEFTKSEVEDFRSKNNFLKSCYELQGKVGHEISFDQIRSVISHMDDFLTEVEWRSK